MESKQPNLGGCFRIFQNSFFIIWISASRVIHNVKYGKAMCCTRMEEEGGHEEEQLKGKSRGL